MQMHPFFVIEVKDVLSSAELDSGLRPEKPQTFKKV
jgi:hypothetical protein